MAPSELSALPSGEKLFVDSSILTSELEVEECYKAIKDHALLTNDTFHVATMKMQGITHIATNDPDFERVGGLKVWKP
jgi:predicted nucleic acid-binding protein